MKYRRVQMSSFFLAILRQKNLTLISEQDKLTIIKERYPSENLKKSKDFSIFEIVFLKEEIS